jgi:hypothetical protein
MKVFHAPDIPESQGRDHPWTHSVDNPDWKYYDFKTQPELIPLVLEDFSKRAHEAAVQRFYLLLDWLNGSGSCLESNDCGLLVPEDNPNIQFPKGRRILARLMVLFRRESVNAVDVRSRWLLDCFGTHLTRVEPTFNAGAVSLARFPTHFVRQNNYGYILQITFASYGDSDEEVMANLDQLFGATHAASLEVNRQIRESGLCPTTATDTQGPR